MVTDSKQCSKWLHLFYYCLYARYSRRQNGISSEI